MTHARLLFVSLVLLLLTVCRERPDIASSPCGTPANPCPDPTERYKAAGNLTCGNIPGGVPGHIPQAYLDEYLAGYNNDPAKKATLVDGLCTWYLWVGGDALMKNPPANAGGNPQFWRKAELITGRIEHLTAIPITVTLLNFINSSNRDTRFRDLGLINDPGCKKRTMPDQYGLKLDDCEDPYSSGIMGLRLFPNPKFNKTSWNAQEYFKTPAKHEPPYLVGLSCGVCHIAFNPLDPPADPERPEWKNLAGAIGNQYVKEGKMFQGVMKDDQFLYWVYQLQQAGTSDTSRLSTDWIDNPNAINSVFFLDSARPKHVEKFDIPIDGLTEGPVPHILKDGADSIGAAGAALRVYVNIGTCADYRMSLEDTLAGIKRAQAPFDITWAEKNCDDYAKTKLKMPNAAAFLDSQHGFPPAGPRYGDGADSPTGTTTVPETDTTGNAGAQPAGYARTYAGIHPDLAKHVNQSLLPRGKVVFAENCARCHSSKIPAGLNARTKHDAAAKSKWVQLVNQPDFLVDNYLADDARYPVISSDPRFHIGTNIKRAVGTNASQGHLWQHFSSRTYKELPSPGTVTGLYNPIDPSKPLTYTIKNGGYYRTPTLIAVWATAPFLHNNALGDLPMRADGATPDPSIAGRMRAYEQAMDLMLNPGKRKYWVKVTPKPTVLKIRGVGVTFPAETPIGLIWNLNMRETLEHPRGVSEALKPLLQEQGLFQNVKLISDLKHGRATPRVKALAEELLKLNTAPDFVEDRGHEFGKELSPEDKRALIEYVKTF